MQEERFDRIDQALREIHQRFDGVDGRFDGVEKRLDGVDGRLDDIKRDMHLLHEDAMSASRPRASTAVQRRRSLRS